MNESSNRIMFLAARRFESEKAIRGACLLTDRETKPIEFRCTNPIRPTQLQSMLYGDILHRHIFVELIGYPLVQSVAKEKPEVVLVTERHFLDLRPKINIPVVLLTKEEQIVTIEENDPEFQLLNSNLGRFEPIILSTHGDFPNDKTQMRELLGDVFNKHDLIEPFTRISSALEQVHAQKIGESQAQ